MITIFFKGRLWSFVLLTIFVTPVLVKKMVERRSKKGKVKSGSLKLNV